MRRTRHTRKRHTRRKHKRKRTRRRRRTRRRTRGESDDHKSSVVADNEGGGNAVA